MYRVKHLLAVFVMTLYMMQGCAVLAEEYCDEECFFSTGIIWGFPNENVIYELSDENLADIIQGEDGTRKVKFNRPGALYVTVRIPEEGIRTVYLMHITGHPVDETAVNRETFAREVLKLVNQARAGAGAAPLHLEEDLARFASVRVREISRVYSHTRPDGRPCHTVFGNARGYCTGENIAAGATSPEQVVEMWMQSEGHRKNILYPDYQEMGVGYLYLPKSEYGHYWVQLFRGN